MKAVLVFFLGIAAGGLIFGFNGPATSQADISLAPADLFSLVRNLGSSSGTGKYKQYYKIRDQYESRYKVVSVGRMSSDDSMWVRIKDK